MRIMSFLDTTWYDLRCAARAYRGSPGGFTRIPTRSGAGAENRTQLCWCVGPVSATSGASRHGCRGGTRTHILMSFRPMVIVAMAGLEPAMIRYRNSETVNLANLSISPTNFGGAYENRT